MSKAKEDKLSEEIKRYAAGYENTVEEDLRDRLLRLFDGVNNVSLAVSCLLKNSDLAEDEVEWFASLREDAAKHAVSLAEDAMTLAALLRVGRGE